MATFNAFNGQQALPGTKPVMSDQDINSNIQQLKGDPTKLADWVKSTGLTRQQAAVALDANGFNGRQDIQNYMNTNAGWDPWGGNYGPAGGWAVQGTTPATNAGTPATPTTRGVTNPVTNTSPATNTTNSLTDKVNNVMAGLNVPAVPTAPGPTPIPQSVLDGADSTQRIAGLLKSGSPVLQQALDKANMQSNSRGLLNSSMGVEAGTQALISEASNIANNDANRFTSLNQTKMSNDTSLANTALSGQISAARDTNNNAFTLARDAVAADTAKTVRDEGYARADQLASRDLQIAYGNDVNTISNALATKISTIQNSDLPPEVKQAQIASETGIAQGLLSMKNTIYTSMPLWQKEWTTLSLKVGG